MKIIEYIELPEFKKDFKRLKKKFKTLPEDFETAKKAAMELYHIKNINNQSTFEIPAINGQEPIYKLKKFACKSLKGKGVKSGIRIIYSWNPKIQKITLIEIYYKGDKTLEDKSRIKNYLKSIKNDA